ncbi:ribosome assembly RNA-binding protein YhbY [Gilvimarinus sp. F26214L]|uniref:ribosome assembly RNA-binding protein YhbY n=1 Tax=Gilvimarinus sp. DZF01 TaxID=3461371 RepID=UPI0040458F71
MLSNDEKKRFRAIGHKLKPIVQVGGKGLTESLLAEVDRALADHELIKIKIAVMDRELRGPILQEVCEKTAAEAVQSIGKTVLLHRPAKKPNPRLSNLIRPL